MELLLLQQILLAGFVIALVLGAVTCKTSFCTMGAVSDIVNIGDSGRMRAWLCAMATAVIGVALIDGFAGADLSLADDGATGKPPYGTPVFVWPRYILGGLLFGVGMTLASGCGNKTLVRIGGGNLKSVVVFLVMGAGAYLMIYTNFGYHLFLRWMPSLDFSAWGLASQGVDELVGHPLGIAGPAWSRITALIIGAAVLAWVFRSRDFRASLDNQLGGFVVGAAVVGAWYLTAGPAGRSLLDEIAFLDEIPYDAGAQSFTFVKPSAHLYYYIQEGFASNLLTFALVAAFGVVAGSFLYSVVSGNFRIEWFAGGGDLARHLIGGFLMGVGGVLSLGCTFGQAITGASTLALGSFITFAAIVLGAALTMKVQYYKMVYEDDATFAGALVASLADLRLMPAAWRKLDRV
ncbi:MAG: YeeE/YedE family protein [Gammaproteobacteria bacterium]|nr:YeeE/YedE family protein [Gammaproteobacteria bacterium]